MREKERYALKVQGIVQGVGFRPFIYTLAAQHHLSGWVLNSGLGVVIEIEGSPSDCAGFLADLPIKAPALSRIDNMDMQQIEPKDEDSFVILPSLNSPKNTLIPPDMSVCEACLADLRDSANRRYRHPFTNCTNCGPRFTIISDLPYDRHNTSMVDFPLCATCEKEFFDPCDRRFHDQPNCCPKCGPQLAYYDNKGTPIAGDPLDNAKADIKRGKIIAVKGLGGYHLVCDALNNEAVATLRSRKLRQNKPFAVMFADMATVKQYCVCHHQEEELLVSQRRPIVLLAKSKAGKQVAAAVAPNNKRLGVMLPYTPLHYLLMKEYPALVMTSANYSDEPIIYREEDSDKLSGLVDAYLTHNRKILHRCDDSVMACTDDGQSFFMRRSRGFVPEPIEIAGCKSNILAVGAEQKNTFCLTRGSQAFMSQHIGDLDNWAAYAGYQQEIAFFEKIFACSPKYLAHDLHHQYLSTHYAHEEYPQLPQIAVQHHHAHLASVLAEHQVEGPAIGLIYDGTGYGTDGHLWGGEILVGDCYDYRRAGHLLYAPLPGGAQAIHEPWRTALGYLSELAAGDAIEQIAPPGLLGANWPVVMQAIAARINTPLTSGMGRLFDAVAALVGIGRVVDYEGQAAIDLEQALACTADGAYAMRIIMEEGEYLLDWREMLEQILADIRKRVDKSIIAARFHRSIINVSQDICLRLREESGINTVVLSGGCWQNIFLLNNTLQGLKQHGFAVLLNSLIPLNDGGIAYGQAAVAAAKIAKGDF